MKTQFSRLVLCFAGGLAAGPFLSAQTIQTAPPPREKAADVREEQRHIADYLTYTGSDLQKGLERAGGNNLDLATVSGLHAVDQLLQCSKLMDKDPQHVEEVRPWLFDNDAARSGMRVNFFNQLKPRYDDLEDRLDGFARSLKERGYSAVFITINKLRAWNSASSPEAKRQIEQEIDQVVTEVSRQAAARPGGGSDASTGLRSLDGAMGAPSGFSSPGEGATTIVSGPATGALGGSVPLGLGMVARTTPTGIVVTDGSGRSALLPGAVLQPDGTARLADGRTVDLHGAAIDPNGGVRLSSGETVGAAGPGEGAAGTAAIADSNSHFVSADGGELTIPADFDWKNGVATGIEKVYVGGRGGRLIRETKVTFRPAPAAQANTFVVARENGEVRSWAFDVAPVQGSEKKSTGSVTIAFELADRNGSTSFATGNWNITGSTGAASVDASNGNQATATFSASGDYKIEVTGKTEWGSDFTIRKSLPVGIE